MNLADILILCAVGLLVMGAILILRHTRKNGRSCGCGSSCSGCSGTCACCQKKEGCSSCDKK